MTGPDPASGAGTPDLSACEQEPIRIPGSIQPHGALFVVEPRTLRVLQAAVGDPTALVGGDPLGRRLPDVLVPEAAALLERIDEAVPAAGLAYLGLVRRGSAVHHVLAHRGEGGVIVELECGADGEPGSFDAVFPHLCDFLDALQRTGPVEELAAFAAREVRRLTGLDRALVYRFDAEWHGAVIAEDRNDNLPSYLGLRFPASDIPAQARALYRQSRLRLIADANYAPAPLRPALHPLSGQPTDLGFAVLRSVSPVHLEYMRNMGTMASMSISLLREGQLWGLISCHNRAPARVPYHVRSACDFIGQLL
ncbi:MAG TPA: GAF domain-containing protein, partial [Acetobacteraceae bacterium]|nr:GAF domain-containing protein [Acetobacteraceae bacterium]